MNNNPTSFIEEIIEENKMAVDEGTNEIITLLLKNNWIKNDYEDDETTSYDHDNANFSIYISDIEIVLVDHGGDFAYLEKNIYTLIGYCYYHRLFLFNI
jgi:hypothetical protein